MDGFRLNRSGMSGGSGTIEEVLAGGPEAGGPDGVRHRGGLRLAVGSDGSPLRRPPSTPSCCWPGLSPPCSVPPKRMFSDGCTITNPAPWEPSWISSPELRRIEDDGTTVGNDRSLSRAGQGGVERASGQHAGATDVGQEYHPGTGDPHQWQAFAGDLLLQQAGAVLAARCSQSTSPCYATMEPASACTDP